MNSLKVFIYIIVMVGITACGAIDRVTGRSAPLQPPPVTQSSDSQSVSSDNSPVRKDFKQGLVGRVTTVSGNPLPNAFIQVDAVDAETTVPELAVVTNAAGIFEWPLPPGSYRVTVLVNQTQVAQTTVTVPDGVLTLALTAR